MEQDAVPEDVRNLLRDAIESHEELEALALLAREPRVPWTPEQLADSIRPAPADAAAVLQNLLARGLAARNGPDAYGYAPANAALDATVQRLLALHRTDLAGVLKLMNSQAIERVRSGAIRAFADAFVLRRDKHGR